MIHGCAPAKSPPVDLAIAPAADVTAIRCPAASPTHIAALRNRVAPLKPDAPEGVTRGAWQAKTDELTIDADAKRRAGLAVAAELERCRGGDAMRVAKVAP